MQIAVSILVLVAVAVPLASCGSSAGASEAEQRERWLHSDNTPLNWKPKYGVISIWGDSNPKVLKVLLDGDGGTVEVQGIGQERPVWLRREQGRWLVDGAEYPV